MSRTDKTAPFWVNLARRDLASVEVHHHESGPCDMPAEYAGALSRRGQRCRREFRYEGVNVCCCRMCHSPNWPDRTPRRRRRRDRHRAKQAMRVEEF